MSKIKVIFFVLFLMSALAVPALALDTTDQISFYYVSINDGYPICCTGGYPQGMGDYNVGSIWVYIPFTAAENYTVNFSLVTGPVSSYGSWVCDYGYLDGRTWSAYGSMDGRMSIVNSPQYDLANDCYQVGKRITLDTSGITPGANWYLRVGCAYANFTLHTSYNGVVGSVSGSSVSPRQNIWVSSAKYVDWANSTVFGYISSLTHVLSADVSGRVLSGLSVSAFLTSSDAEAVAQLEQVNATLDGMADNLQTITDDFKARDAIGDDISGVTSDSQIASGTSGLSTGSSSLSSAISGLPSFASVIAPTSGFISFLTSPVQQIFAFGNGYLLYIATAMVLLSVVFWVIRRMGGDSS